MPAFKASVHVYLEGVDEPVLVEYDQRDVAKMETLELKGRTTVVRGMAWAAMHRQKLYRGAWEKFNEVDCVEVCDPPEAEELNGAEDGLDPGRTDGSVGS
jgi:hypothetical protein